MNPELNRLYVYDGGRYFNVLSKKGLGRPRKYNNQLVVRYALSVKIDNVSKTLLIITNVDDDSSMSTFLAAAKTKISKSSDIHIFKASTTIPLPTSLTYK